jgi:hypothetical protein
LYRTGKLEFGHLRSRFPLLAARHPAASAGDKAILYLGVDETDSSTRSARLKAIILPVIAEVNGAKLEPTSPASAMAALGPSSVVQVPGLGATTFAFLANIVRALPCYTLRVDDPKAVPAALLALVA